MKTYILLVLFFVSSVASAKSFNFAVGGGFMRNKPDLKTEETGGVSVHENSTSTFNIGARVLFPLENGLSLRSGLYFQEKSGEIEFSASGLSGEIIPKILEFAIPLNVQYQFHEKFSAYGGYIMDLPINTYCEVDGIIDTLYGGCPLSEDAKVTHNLNLGGSLHVNEIIDLELSYQHPMKAVLNDLKLYTWLFQVFYKI